MIASNKTRENLILSIALFLFSLIISSNLHAETLLVIANKDNPEQTMDVNTVKRIYVGNIKFFKGQIRIQPFNLPSEINAYKTFFKEILNITPRRYKFNWRKIELAGRGIEPKKLSNTKELLEQVSKKKGAIGYIFESDITEEFKDKIKILFKYETSS